MSSEQKEDQAINTAVAKQSLAISAGTDLTKHTCVMRFPSGTRFYAEEWKHMFERVADTDPYDEEQVMDHILGAANLTRRTVEDTRRVYELQTGMEAGTDDGVWVSFGRIRDDVHDFDVRNFAVCPAVTSVECFSLLRYHDSLWYEPIVYCLACPHGSCVVYSRFGSERFREGWEIPEDRVRDAEDAAAAEPNATAGAAGGAGTDALIGD